MQKNIDARREKRRGIEKGRIAFFSPANSDRRDETSPPPLLAPFLLSAPSLFPSGAFPQRSRKKKQEGLRRTTTTKTTPTTTATML
jgi:hypothetical protein